ESADSAVEDEKQEDTDKDDKQKVAAEHEVFQAIRTCFTTLIDNLKETVGRQWSESRFVSDVLMPTLKVLQCVDSEDVG
ncbi:hypothetical protein BGX31_006895, partial [Mortierella sp. GBA43]